MSLYTEILEQPTILKNLLAGQSNRIAEIAASIRRAEVDYVFLAARGSSDNAGRYANYLWGAHNSLPVALATPSLFTYYQRPPRLKNALVVGVSQSGQSPDIVEVVSEGRRQGCPTLAITNAPESALAQVADFVIDIHARHEKAIAATKTYTAQLLAMAIFSAALAQDESRLRELERVPAWAEEAIALDAPVAPLVQRFRYMEHCAVIGRGYNYATAFEWSLKLMELAYLIAEPYSSADFLHGPIAMVQAGFPALTVATGGDVFPPVLEMLQRLRREHNAELVVISDRRAALDLAQSPITMPEGIPEWLSPILNIIPAQLFCYHLTRAKGYDPDVPRGLHKVTRTR